jgi:hypothetical protein
MIESGALGKKVFFLNPHPVMSEVTEELAKREFEVYLVRDHEKLAKGLADMPDSIVFINIDEGESAWEDWVKKLRADERTASVGIGILTMNEDKELAQKYLMDLQVPCGFVVVKLGAAKTLEILVKTLEANEARGRRKFVRSACQQGAAQCIFTLDGRQIRAEVSDLSSAGMALSCGEADSFKPGSVIRSLQLAVKGSHVIADGFVVAQRPGEGRMVNIVMFDPNSLTDEKKDKLRSLVSKLNQSAMDKQLAAL